MTIQNSTENSGKYKKLAETNAAAAYNCVYFPRLIVIVNNLLIIVKNMLISYYNNQQLSCSGRQSLIKRESLLLVIMAAAVGCSSFPCSLFLQLLIGWPDHVYDASLFQKIFSLGLF